MKLVSDEKIHSEVEKYTNKSSLEWISFVNGAHFAEAELQNLAIEFAEWIDINGVRSDEHVWRYRFDNYVKKFTSSEMFEKFVEQRDNSY